MLNENKNQKQKSNSDLVLLEGERFMSEKYNIIIIGTKKIFFFFFYVRL